MRIPIVLLIIISLYFFNVKAQEIKDVEFLIAPAMCSNDSVDIKINGVNVLNREVIITDLSGASNIQIYQNKDGLWLEKSGIKTHFDRLKNLEDIEIEFSVNRNIVKKKLAISNGRYIVINYCVFRKPSKAIINQFKNWVGFE